LGGRGGRSVWLREVGGAGGPSGHTFRPPGGGVEETGGGGGDCSRGQGTGNWCSGAIRTSTLCGTEKVWQPRRGSFQGKLGKGKRGVKNKEKKKGVGGGYGEIQ